MAQEENKTSSHEEDMKTTAEAAAQDREVAEDARKTEDTASGAENKTQEAAASQAEANASAGKAGDGAGSQSAAGASDETEAAGAAGSAGDADDGSATGASQEETAGADDAGTSGVTDVKLQKLKDEYEKKLKDEKDQYLRLFAEFDNFRKRSDKEKSQMFDMGARNVLEKVLPIIDNFERALATIPEEEKDKPFTKGVEGIYKQVQKMCDELDVKPIEAEGKKFDPDFHNAVMTDTESDVEEDIITQDLQKGYTYKGQVIRHSMVKVKK